MKIHFLSTRAVAQELRGRTIEASSAFVYFAIWLVFTTAVNYIDIYMMGPPDLLLIVHGIVTLVISIGGLYSCYIANGGVGGIDLLVRFAALSLPLTIKLQIAYEAIYWVLYFAYPKITTSLTDADYESVWRRIAFVLAIMFIIIWYGRMRIWLTRVATSN